MKKLFILMMFAMASLTVHGQEGYQDVIYLRNGSVIRGKIIERMPGESYKIETAERNVLVFQMEEIDRITKENSALSQAAIDSYKPRRGYIGISLGPSYPLGDFADDSLGAATNGIHLNLINFGYRFGRNLGITFTWYGMAHPVNVNGYDPWSVGGLLIGPMVSVHTFAKAELDLRMMIGYGLTTFPSMGNQPTEETAFAYDIGFLFRYNLFERVSLLMEAAYFHTRPEYIWGYKQDISTFSLGWGIAYRIR